MKMNKTQNASNVDFAKLAKIRKLDIVLVGIINKTLII